MAPRYISPGGDYIYVNGQIYHSDRAPPQVDIPQTEEVAMTEWQKWENGTATYKLSTGPCKSDYIRIVLPESALNNLRTSQPDVPSVLFLRFPKSLAAQSFDKQEVRLKVDDIDGTPTLVLITPNDDYLRFGETTYEGREREGQQSAAVVYHMVIQYLGFLRDADLRDAELREAELRNAEISEEDPATDDEDEDAPYEWNSEDEALWGWMKR